VPMNSRLFMNAWFSAWYSTATSARDASAFIPTAAGHYTARTQDFGMTLTFKF
jgi:hypothetical protein